MTRSVAGRKRPIRPSISVIVEHRGWRDHRQLVATIRRAASMALSVLGHGDRQRIGADSATILLSGDEQIQELNAKFRNLQKPTNVLAFPAVTKAFPYAGDVALAYGVIRAEAKDQKKTLAAHAAHLTIHGVLHLLGYDHHQTADAKVMENQEILLMRRLGFENPYEPLPVRRRKMGNKVASCPTTIAVR